MKMVIMAILCLGCKYFTKLFDDGTVHEARCFLDGGQSGTFMQVTVESDCDSYDVPKINRDIDKYPIRRHDGKRVHTLVGEPEKPPIQSTAKRQMRDQPMYRRPRKKRFGNR